MEPEMKPVAARHRFRLGQRVRANQLASDREVCRAGWIGTVEGFGHWPEIIHVRGKKICRTYHHIFFEPVAG